MMQGYIRDTDCESIEEGYLHKLQVHVKRFTQTAFAREWGLNRAWIASPDTPRLFAFAKTHKEYPSIRPILDKARSPTRALENEVHKRIYDHINDYNWSIRNPIELIEELKNLSITDSTYITVLDFVSLYPSIKIEPCFCEFRDLLLTYPGAVARRKHILELAHILCYSSFFRFNNKTYIQKRGVPMGSPLSGDLCELVIRKLEQQIIPLYNSNMLLYRRYVDDVLIIWRTEPNVNIFIKEMNNNPYGLKIKLDQKSNRAAHFLDLNIQLMNKRISYKVFYKECYVPMFIPANSEDPYPYKIAAFRALTKRAFTHHSEWKDTIAELEHIQGMATQHGYGKNLVYNIARAYIRKRESNTPDIPDVPLDGNSKRKIVEYNHHLANIYREISSRTNNKVTYSRPRSIYSLLRNGKDTLDLKCAPGVYSIPIWDDRFNNKLVYVGSTKRSLRKRLQEHKYDIDNNKHTTTLSTVATEPGIRVDLQNARMVRLSQRTDQLRIMETLEIYKAGLNNTCINSKDAVNISKAWKFCYEETPHT
ncbi:uncharacterized protein LOC111633935 [Centruroides sculpturatus]|uniref:uncharacterized protein LOC111633935 n=1 Tax=Centruroides sculpturatus TaxID=218467 RepID=UPI000C6DDC99|nr:uncharacterized protein LOC111633935 [Centruroides sculpturatus]